MSEKSVITFRVVIPKWVQWYIASLQFFCDTFGTVPNYDKVTALVKRHTKLVRI